jgi:hypothetical protein
MLRQWLHNVSYHDMQGTCTGVSLQGTQHWLGAGTLRDTVLAVLQCLVVAARPKPASNCWSMLLLTSAHACCLIAAGGRGRGGRGGSNNLGINSVTNERDMVQLQLAAYSIAAAPKVWLPENLPPVRYQGIEPAELASWPRPLNPTGCNLMYMRQFRSVQYASLAYTYYCINTGTSSRR